MNQLFFSTLLVQEHQADLDVQLDNLSSRREVMETGIEHGLFIATDLKLIDVEILKLKQAQITLEAWKSALMGMLKVMYGDEFPDNAILGKPHFNEPGSSKRIRPEYHWFELKNASLEAGKELVARKRMPVVYAFGQTGYGKPGYNLMNDQWDFYYMVGAGLRWNVWDWSQNRRERQVIEQQQQILTNSRATFDKGIRSLVVKEESNIMLYEKSEELDYQVLQLQKEIARQAATKLANGTITATEFLIEINKEHLARISLSTHQIQHLQSIVNYLTIQGKL